LDKEELKKILEEISKEELIRFILQRLEEKEKEKVPISIFSTDLSPLEAIVRYLKEKQNKKISQIAKILNKNVSSISTAYKNARSKKFVYKEEKLWIPLSEFKDNPQLSILENVVRFLRNKGMKFTTISSLLNRSPKTIWTIYKRAKKKNAA